jgi:hypothetical protein
MLRWRGPAGLRCVNWRAIPRRYRWPMENGPSPTYKPAGMLFSRRSTWVHVVEAAGSASGMRPEALLGEEEVAAVSAWVQPGVLWTRR